MTLFIHQRPDPPRHTIAGTYARLITEVTHTRRSTGSWVLFHHKIQAVRRWTSRECTSKRFLSLLEYWLHHVQRLAMRPYQHLLLLHRVAFILLAFSVDLELKACIAVT